MKSTSDKSVFLQGYEPEEEIYTNAAGGEIRIAGGLAKLQEVLQRPTPLPKFENEAIYTMDDIEKMVGIKAYTFLRKIGISSGRVSEKVAFGWELNAAIQRFAAQQGRRPELFYSESVVDIKPRGRRGKSREPISFKDIAK